MSVSFTEGSRTSYLCSEEGTQDKDSCSYPHGLNRGSSLKSGGYSKGYSKDIIHSHVQGGELDGKMVTVRKSFSLVVPIHEAGKLQPSSFLSHKVNRTKPIEANRNFRILGLQIGEKQMGVSLQTSCPLRMCIPGQTIHYQRNCLSSIRESFALLKSVYINTAFPLKRQMVLITK